MQGQTLIKTNILLKIKILPEQLVARQIFSRIDQYFHFIIINAENATLHKHITQNGRSMFKVISEIIEKFALIPIENSSFFVKLILTIHIVMFKIKHDYVIIIQTKLVLI